MPIVGTNASTPYQGSEYLPDSNQGWPQCYIQSVTPVGAHGAVPAVVSGPAYDVFPVKLPNGQYTMGGAKASGWTIPK